MATGYDDEPELVGIDYRCRSHFASFHRRKQRWACIVAHRRAGKTVACVMELIDRALSTDKQDARYSYVAPTYSMAKDVAWLYLKRFTANIPGVEQRESDLVVNFPNGNRVRLYGAEHYDRLRGTYNDGMILDEYADISPRAWPEVLRPSLADRRGWAVFIGTPRGRNDFWRVHRYAETHPESWYSLVLRADETMLLPQDELDDLRAGMTPEAYAQELDCSFDAAILGSYYGKEIARAEEEKRICKVEVDPLLPVHTAWDLGISDATAIWFFQVHLKQIRVVDYYEAAGYNLSHYAGILAAKDYVYGREFLPHDSMAREMGTGRSIFETLKQLTGRHPYLVPKLSVMDGINAGRLTLGGAWIDAERCYDGLEALRAYRTEFNDKTKAFSDHPRHDWASHGADAWRYMSLAWRELQPPKPAPPPVDHWAKAFERASRNEAEGWRTA